jgi:hypothetical protein
MPHSLPCSVYPLDTIRRLQQVSSLVASTADGPASWSFRRVCERVHGERGARGFFAGLSASFLKAVPSAAVSVLALSEISKRISPPDESR